MTQPKTDLAYLRSEKAKAEQKLRSCQHRDLLERNRYFRLCIFRQIRFVFRNT